MKIIKMSKDEYFVHFDESSDRAMVLNKQEYDELKKNLKEVTVISFRK